MRNKHNIRWFYLVIGTVAMLFAGVIYSWSILKAPLATEFGWTASALSINYTLMVCALCLGSMAGSFLAERIGPKFTLLIAGILAGGGFLLSAGLSGKTIAMLYLTYGIMGGFGIGVAYNTITATVGLWFPDKKGLCSGCLMMGFGASSLLLGNVAERLIVNQRFGWRATFYALGAALGIVMLIAAIVLKRPSGDMLAATASKKNAVSVCHKDYKPKEMLRQATFWKAFFCVSFLSAVGSAVISFAKDLALSIGAEAALATILVGLLSICNGFGRILTGILIDAMGCKKVIIIANVTAILAAFIAMISVVTNSMVLCVIGLCFTGLSYGSTPTINSTFISTQYGQKYFATNFSFIAYTMMPAACIAAAAGALFDLTNSFVTPFVLLLVLAVFALGLGLSIKQTE